MPGLLLPLYVRGPTATYDRDSATGRQTCPGALDQHLHSGSRKLLDARSEELLFKYFDDKVLPYMQGSAVGHRKAFEFFYETWNVVPEHEPPTLSASVRQRLQQHFAEDAEELQRLGYQAPWLEALVD